MATAIVANKQTAAEQEYQAAHAAYMKASHVVEGYAARQTQLEEEIAQLTHQYDRECMEAAAGNGIDPMPTLNSLQARKSLLHGTLQQRAKAEAEAEPLAAKVTEAGRQLREAQWAVEEEELTEAVKAADAAAVQARKAEMAAGGKLSDAIRARDNFRKRSERERKESL